MPLNKDVLVLLSGGIDSTACVAYYIERGFNIQALFVDYGQLSAERELLAVERIRDSYGIPVTIVKCVGSKKHSAGFIQGRNAFLLHTALMNLNQSGIIAIGIHSGTTYLDCSSQFIKIMQASFDIYTDGRIMIDAPFIEWSKQDIWDYCKGQKVPVELTYSCENGVKQPCARCPSCQDLEALYACEK